MFIFLCFFLLSAAADYVSCFSFASSSFFLSFFLSFFDSFLSPAFSSFSLCVDKVCGVLCGVFLLWCCCATVTAVVLCTLLLELNSTSTTGFLLSLELELWIEAVPVVLSSRSSPQVSLHTTCHCLPVRPQSQSPSLSGQDIVVCLTACLISSWVWLDWTMKTKSVTLALAHKDKDHEQSRDNIHEKTNVRP